MKKNININMFGRLYSIDEDAYELLRTYEDSLRSYFEKRDGGREIVEDIEARIAELFDAYLAEGHEAISLEQMQSIISRLGNPQQMDDEEPESASADSHQDQSDNFADRGTHAQSAFDDAKSAFSEGMKDTGSFISRLLHSDRKLYRDTTDKKLTGLLSGIARFFDVNVFVVRLGFLLLVLLSMSFAGFIRPLTGFPAPNMGVFWVLAYFVVSFLTPAADSPATRLKQQGREVTPEHLAQEVAAESVRQQTEATREPRQGCAAGFFRVSWIIFRFCLFVMLGFTAIALLCWSCWLAWVLTAGGELGSFVDEEFCHMVYSMPVVVIIHIVSCGLLALVPIYCITHNVLSNSGKLEPMGGGQRLAWVMLFIAGLVAVIISGTLMAIKYSVVEDQSYRARWAQSDENTLTRYEGIKIRTVDAKYLEAKGWHLLRAEGCDDDRVTSYGEYLVYYQQDHRYLDCHNDDGRQLLRVERTDSMLKAGNYELTVNVRSDGRGAQVYALADGKTYRAEIPAYGNEGGPIWQEADSIMTKIQEEEDAAVESLPNARRREKERYERRSLVNGGRGYGWTTVTISGIKARKGRISYGVATDPAFTGATFEGTWLSATDFHLKAE